MVPGSSVKRLRFGHFFNNQSLKDRNGLFKAAKTCLKVHFGFSMRSFLAEVRRGQTARTFHNSINRKISDGHAKIASTKKILKNTTFAGHQHKFENTKKKDRALT